MREKLNCPNCGAPITGVECEYCGTLFYDFASIDLDKPTYLKIKWNDQIITCKAVMRSFNIELTNETIDCYSGKGYAVKFVTTRNATCDVEFDLLPDENDFLLQRRQL